MLDYETVLFDLYGTLVDIHTDENMSRLWRDFSRFLGTQNVEYTPAELKEAYFTLVHEKEEELSAEGSGDAHEAHPEIDLAGVFRDIYEARGVTEITNDVIAQTAVCFRKASTTHMRLYAGVSDLLHTLKEAGKHVILLSNAQSLFTIPELRELGIYDVFDRIYISSDYGCKKPDPSFFMLPVRDMDLNPAGCLMIGNDPVCDVQGALNAGMDAYYIHSALSPKLCPDQRMLGIDEDHFQDHMDLRLLKNRLILGQKLPDNKTTGDNNRY